MEKGFECQTSPGNLFNKELIMKKNMLRTGLNVGISLLMLLVWAAGAGAKIPEPDNIIYGAAPAGATVLTLKIGGVDIVSYTMGSVPSAGDYYYILRVPMDSVDEQTDGTARTGDLADIFVDDDPTAVTTITLADRGTVIKKHLDADTDGDGLTDAEENDFGSNPDNPDSDGDGLYDGDELLAGTNPMIQDTDGDGVWDSLDLNPLNQFIAQALGGEFYLADTYFAVDISFDSSSEASSMLDVSFNSGVNYNVLGEKNSRSDGSNQPVSRNDIYVLDPSGLGFLSGPGASTFDMSAVTTKDIIVYSDVRDNSLQLAGVAVKSAGSDAYSDSSLNGTYHFSSMILATTGSFCDKGQITFDGNSEYSIVGTDINGGYSVNEDGSFILNTSDTSYLTGGISADNNLLVAANVSKQNEQSVWFGVKSGQDDYTISDLIGTYYMTGLSVDLGGYRSSMGKIVFNGNGWYNMESRVNQELPETITLVASSGTYAIGTDGTFEISQVEEGQDPVIIGSLALAQDGKSFVFSNVTDPDIQGIGFGVRLLPSDCDPDTDVDTDGSDLASFINSLQSGENTITLEEFSANFGYTD